MSNRNNFWPKRLFSLDVSRGFAALAMVLWHWQHFAFNGAALSQNFDRGSQPLYEILMLFYEKGLRGAEYFFLLSGFIFFWLYGLSIKKKSTSFTYFWVLRISRLYPLHFVTLLIVALLQAIHISHNGSSFVYTYNDVYHFFLHLGFASNWGFESGFSFNGPVWSVSIEILLYFIFFIVAYLRLEGILSCLVVSIIFFSITLFIYSKIFNAISMFFLGGFVFHATFIISTKFQNLKIAIIAVAILSWIITIVNFYAYNLSGYILHFGVIGKILLYGFPLYILFPFTLSALVLVEIDKGKFLKSISWIGDITYSSYLLHFPIQLVFGLAVSYGVLNSTFYLNPIYLLVFFSILIPLSYVTFIGFERPMQNIIRNKYRYRKSVEPSASPANNSDPLHCLR